MIANIAVMFVSIWKFQFRIYFLFISSQRSASL